MPPISDAQKAKLRAAQLRYIASDPRWASHREKLAKAKQEPQTRERLSKAQLAYMATDPRWPDHRARCQEAALEVTRITLLPQEIDAVMKMRSKGRNFEYIAEELCVSDKIIRRELKALGISTSRVPPRPKAKCGKGHWRSFDNP